MKWKIILLHPYVFLFYSVLSLSFMSQQYALSASLSKRLDPKEERIYAKDAQDWETFVQAMIWVESRGQIYAVNKDCVGIFQIRPIYVKDVNRILKEERYTNDDRYHPKKSREMFDIIQNHYNPNKDMIRAIKLHNPTEKTGDYQSKILKRYYERKK